MRKKLASLVLWTMAILTAGGAIAQQARNAHAQIELQEAIRTETVVGDLQNAIRQYENIMAKYASDRALTASVLLRMAGCYEKLGHLEARNIYQRILREKRKSSI